MALWIDGTMALYPGDGIGQVLLCMGNAEISVRLAGQYYCGKGGRGSNPLFFWLLVCMVL